jgi:AraC-like DNA-binding protein
VIKNYFLFDYKEDDVDFIYKKILNSGGNLKIEELIEQLNLNYRTLRRKFLNRTGISMKGLCRIVRVNKLWKTSLEYNEIDPQALVYLCGYFDQAHLIHDFKNIIGESPKSFLSRDMQNTKILSGVK